MTEQEATRALAEVAAFEAAVQARAAWLLAGAEERKLRAGFEQQPTPRAAEDLARAQLLTERLEVAAIHAQDAWWEAELAREGMALEAEEIRAWDFGPEPEQTPGVYRTKLTAEQVNAMGGSGAVCAVDERLNCLQCGDPAPLGERFCSDGCEERWIPEQVQPQPETPGG